MGSRGSGKTTIANLAFSNLERRGYTCIRQYPGLTRRPFLKSLVTAIYLWRFFDFELFISLGFRGRVQSRWPSLYRLYMPLAFAHDLHCLASSHTDILVYDSNVLRGLMSGVARGEIDPESVANLYARKVLSSAESLLLAVVETDPTEAVERWSERDGIKLSNADRVEAIAERADAKEAMDLVINALAQLPNVTVVRLDGDKTPEDNSEDVVTATARVISH